MSYNEDEEMQEDGINKGNVITLEDLMANNDQDTKSENHNGMDEEAEDEDYR